MDDKIDDVEKNKPDISGLATKTSLNDYLKTFFIQSIPLYASCLFLMLLNNDIVNIEKPDGIYSPTFVVDEFSGLFLHISVFSIKHSRSA